MQPHTCTHTKKKCCFWCVLSTIEGLRHVHLVPSQIWIFSAHPLANEASMRNSVCVCVWVCLSVCMCVIRNLAWSPLVCAFGSVCERAAAQPEVMTKKMAFLVKKRSFASLHVVFNFTCYHTWYHLWITCKIGMNIILSNMIWFNSPLCS